MPPEFEDSATLAEQTFASIAAGATRAAELKAAGHPPYNPPPPKLYVYFIRAGIDGPIKIGYTRNLARRLERLQNGNHRKLTVLAKMLGGPELEAEFHERLADHRIRGEWFRPVPELLDFIRELKATRPNG